MARQALLLCLGVSKATDIYKSDPTTRNGCKCTSGCMTSNLFYCDAAEFCYVDEAECPKAEWSTMYQSHYDWCIHPQYVEYESLTAEQKQAILLQEASSGGSGSYPHVLSVLPGIVGESVQLSFESNSDIFPQEERRKYIHSVGVVGGVSFTSTTEHSYTGLFQGADFGIVRFSSAKEPSNSMLSPTHAGFTPGMGLKLLRDGRPSANFVAMYSLDGQGCEDRDFFQYNWSNHVPMTSDFGLQLLAAKFWQASYCPLKVGLSDLATEEEGSPAKPGDFPFQLIFKANVYSECDCGDYERCLQNLEEIKEGYKLFDVLAVVAPGAPAEPLGELVLTTALKRSQWGDERFFFKHQHMEDDFAIQPEWLSALDLKKDCGMFGVTTEPPSLESGCSSPFSMLETDAVTV